MAAVTRYIIRLLFGPLALVSLTLSGIIWVTLSLRFIERIVNQGLALSTFAYFSALLLPGVLAAVLPIAIFCAVIYVYYRLASESELVVLWANGFSRWMLAKPALIVAVSIMMTNGFLLFWLAPLSQQMMRQAQYELRNSLANLVVREGVFNTPMPGLTVYIRDRSADDEMLGILVHDSRDPRRPVTMMAASGTLAVTPQGPRLILLDGNRQQLEENRRQLGLLYFDSYTLDLGIFLKPQGPGWREPSERFLQELFRPNLADVSDRNNYWQLLVEGHRRIAALLMVPALALLALAPVLAGEHSRGGLGRRMTIAILAALALQVFGFAGTYLAGKTPLLLPLIYLNPLAFGLAATVFLARQQRRPVLAADPGGA
jgi:lipopolysaccharide export system permease protein